MTEDGIRLSAWEIVRPDTKKLAVVNHPLMCNRYGSTKGVDDVPVEFIPMLRHLYTAGYSILTYDQRGQGDSDGNVGAKLKGPKECACGSGAEEWKDVSGIMNYVRANWGGHDVALVGQCMGANAIFKAFTVSPTAFDGVKLKCFAALQPTRSTLMRGRMTKLKMGVDVAEDAGKLQEELFGFKGVDCVEHAPDVKVPIFIAGMQADVYAGDDKEKDIQIIFDAVTTEKKLLFFGPGTDHPFGNGLRFEGYSFYNYHPEPLIEFLDSYMGGQTPAQKTGEETGGYKPASQPPTVVMQKDEDHAACQECGAKFCPINIMPRRHHCRVCGRVLCSKCSSHKVGGQRACLPCWGHAEVEQMNSTGETTATKFETSVDIDAPASVVWSLLTDGMEYNKWSTSMQSIEGDIKEGGQVKVNFKFMGLDFSVPHTVCNFEAGVQWSWCDEVDHGISLNHLYRLEAIDATHSKFINNAELTGGDQVIRYSVLRDMKKSFEEFNEEVKTQVGRSKPE